MSEEISKAYYDMISNYYFDKRYMTEYNKAQVVLIISPKSYWETRTEQNDKVIYLKSNYDINIDYFSILGNKVPVIIDESLPENIYFIFQYREDYERLEQQKLFKRFYKMFEELEDE